MSSTPIHIGGPRREEASCPSFLIQTEMMLQWNAALSPFIVFTHSPMLLVQILTCFKHWSLYVFMSVSLRDNFCSKPETNTSASYSGGHSLES